MTWWVSHGIWAASAFYISDIISVLWGTQKLYVKQSSSSVAGGTGESWGTTGSLAQVCNVKTAGVQRQDKMGKGKMRILRMLAVSQAARRSQKEIWSTRMRSLCMHHTWAWTQCSTKSVIFPWNDRELFRQGVVQTGSWVLRCFGTWVIINTRLVSRKSSRDSLCTRECRKLSRGNIWKSNLKAGCGRPHKWGTGDINDSVALIQARVTSEGTKIIIQSEEQGWFFPLVAQSLLSITPLRVFWGQK